MDTGMTRRDLIAAGASAVLVGGAGLASMANAADEHAGMQHGTNPHQKIIDASLECERTGELCVAHCLAAFRNGDVSLAACATAVEQMLPACAAAGRVVVYGSPRAIPFAKVCADICADCERECRRHEDKHPACKACADACAAFVAAVKNA
ncbi:MAG: Csp1 family four helix bundle copper storage protein [Candidatus Binatia bacterium]